MSTLSASATPPPSGLLIDPTKQAEYPILLGDKLAGKSDETRFINITYNHKSKSATPQQRATITRSSTSRDIYNLTIKDKAGNAEQTTLTYTYRGSVDPSLPVQESDTRNLVLVFDPKRKAFILEPVSTNLNFNLRSAPGKTDKQVLEQYPQLSTLPEDDQASGDDRSKQEGSDDERPEAADDSNPYDYRHFLPKENTEKDKQTFSTSTTPDPHNTASKVNTPTLSATKEAKPKLLPRTKLQTNPLRQVKRPPKAAAASASSATTRSQPKSAPRVDPEDIVFESAPSDEEQRDNKRETSKIGATPSPNIIIDGDLIIDMGSPPPTRPFRVNPAHFSSNNSSANEADDDDDDEEEIEDLRLPSPARQGDMQADGAQHEEASDDEMEEDDPLAAEMEAAFEEEEVARQQQQAQYTVPSDDDESEVSEEE
ncbi:hypothetical protein VTN77DRAFT_174 [Rasamsonia byssochlamydoides]|uniref:uncharacterized protein n=1 Tax=Rasamsonia byssochlamydoides TaxID=89139 RepID=UPI003741FFB4